MRNPFCVAASVVSALLLVGVASSPAQDHLEPTRGYFSTYAHSHAYLETVRSVLVKNAASSAALVVCLPSFGPEWAAYLDGGGDEWTAVVVEPAEQIWGADSPSTIVTSRLERKIPSDMAKSIWDIFRSSVTGARYSANPRTGNDGVTYVFVAFVPTAGPRAGEIWSPEEGSITFELTVFADALADYARGKYDDASLRRKIERLQKRIKPAQPGATDNPDDAQ